MEKSIKTENNRKKGFKKVRIKEIIKAHECRVVQEDMQFTVLHHVATTHEALSEYLPNREINY